MSYKKASHILPPELLKQVQEYVEGEAIYIPRLEAHKKEWGERTATRQELRERNEQIFSEYLSGRSVGELAEQYFLSAKSIWRIIGQEKKKREG